MSTSTNKGYDLQATGSNFGTWGVNLNSNYSIIDLNLGGLKAANVAGSSNVTVSAGDAQNVIHSLSGVLTGNIEYIFPNKGAFYIVKNGTTGNFTVKATSNMGGTGIFIPQGGSTLVFINSGSTTVEEAITFITTYSGTSVGTNTITATFPGSLSAYAAGQAYSFKAGGTNTGAATLNINSLGAKAVQKLGAALVAGDITLADIVSVEYDGTQFQLLSPARTPVLTANGVPLTKLESGTQGDIPFYNSAGNMARLGIGTAGTVLTSQGAAADPVWSGGTVPTGSVIDFGGTAAPTGFLLCYGQAVSRSTYSVLFGVIGTTFGTGDGSTTFNIPDIRGRVTAGQDDMGGSSANRLTGLSGGVDGDVLGAAGGLETHSLTDLQNGPHTHTGGVSTPTSHRGTATSSFSLTQAVSTGSSGSGDPHNNVQPTIIMNKIIKT